ncbi:hypothetical protein Fmac_015784 [Flemingia macrophylla]|uniref:Uncharacterized protein n=1 Tax=Flemingia macrophylla TaxID=520843 RepID=A0ABD1MFI8_9FABA
MIDVVKGLAFLQKEALKILDVLKYQNITGFEACSCKKARPLTTPIINFTSINHRS